MDYSKWAAEYFTEAEKIYQKLITLKKVHRQPENENNRELNRRIVILYSMYLECKHTGELLADRGGEHIVFKPRTFTG